MGFEYTIRTDIGKTTVIRDSLKFRYHIDRATPYANFIYNQLKKLQNSTWQAIDQFEPMDVVNIHCEFDDCTRFRGGFELVSLRCSTRAPSTI